MALKKLGKLGARVGLATVTGGLSEIGPGRQLRDKILSGNLGGETIGPDAEAAELRRIKLKAALGEEAALDKFRQRLDEDPSQSIRYGIEQENKALGQLAQDQQRAIQDRMRRSGLSNTSIGINAMRLADDEARQRMAGNMASFQNRLDEEKLKRLSEFRNVAGQTLSGQNVPIRFQATKLPGLLDRLLPVAGAGIGGAMGGATGAGVGANLGMGFQGMFG